jgi:hypothetical protein
VQLLDHTVFTAVSIVFFSSKEDFYSWQRIGKVGDKFTNQLSTLGHWEVINILDLTSFG